MSRAAVLPLVSALALLGTPPASPADAVRRAHPPSADPSDAEVRSRIEAQRRAMVSYFRDNAWSPLRAFARFDFLPGEGGRDPAATLGAGDQVEVRLAAPGIAAEQVRITVLPPEGDGAPYRFRVERLAPGGDVRLDGEPLPESGEGATKVVPEETRIEIGPFAVRPYVQAEAGILILFDRRRTEEGHFVPPAHYPVDLGWRFRVPLLRIPEPETVSMQTSLGRAKEYRRVGSFEVEAPPGSEDGRGAADAGAGGRRKVRVYAYQPAFVAQKDAGLSVLFTDLTTGKESYATGRYIDLKAPVDGLYTLDFNAAYNPLCAYTHVYNCPIPPRENSLPVAVRAGEKDYPGRAHP